MFCLSVRISELRALKWSDYNKEEKTIHLNHSIVTKRDGDTHRKATDVNYMKRHSEAGKRDLEVSDFAENILAELYKLNGDKEYILQSHGEMPISTNNFNEHLKKYCAECGIRYLSSHKIRFYVCSRMYDLGMDEKTIQSNMGHSSLDMTRHYDRRKKKPVERSVVNSVFGFNISG